VLLRLAIVIVLIAGGLWVATIYVSRPLFSEQLSDLPPLPALADRSEALTLTRSAQGLLLVTGIAGSQWRAVDLTARFGEEATRDTLRFYQEIGYEALATLLAPEITVSTDELLLPVTLGEAHLAAGTNYAEHAEEVLLDDPPFLFPKLAKPTSWNAPVSWVKRLDYEAELAAIPLSTVTDPAEHTDYALLLSNDFTDRLTLVREIDLDQPMGTTGFAAAKGQASFLPIGPWVLIPRRADFYRDLEIRLYVNGRLRQRFRVRDMILSVDDIVRQAFRDRSMAYRRGSSPVDLIPAGGVVAGSMILTGTAGGVMFKLLNIWWQGAYLQPGDVVRTEASYLGALENTVVLENDTVTSANDGE
jgi:2-keto-4-pentenoate hydratase/2-oxohepta-3-ene-1,7-dioic acid hydratase in catechol pathway